MRLMVTAENVIYGLRTRAFSHVHRLSLAHHNEAKRGVLVARVTSDIETLSQFASWGAVSWVVNSTIILVSLVVIAIYSWQLALVTLVVIAPIIPVLRLVQKRQLDAYDDLRTRVSDTLSEISETVTGIRAIRAYADVPAARGRLFGAIDRQYRSQLRARFFFAIMFPVSDVFSGLTLAAVVGVGVWWGPEWGLSAATLIAVVFLANLIVQPVAEIGEVLDQTQTALAGWRKVLDLLDEPIDVVEPEPGVVLGGGALDVRVEDVGFEYEPGHPVLRDVDLHLPAGVNVAIVGETGSGKTTLAKLLSPPGGSRPTGRILRRRGRPARGRPGVAVDRDPTGAPGRVPVRDHHRRERAVRSTRRHRRRGRRGVRRARARLVGRRACPTAWTPTSANVATRCRSGSASWSRSPGRSSPTRVC